jgi:mediator of RNA polymerase II transcription subunit 10
MEICAGDVGQGMEGAVPAYMWVLCLGTTASPRIANTGRAKINMSFKVLSDLSARMTESVPKQVIEYVVSSSTGRAPDRQENRRI